MKKFVAIALTTFSAACGVNTTTVVGGFNQKACEGSACTFSTLVSENPLIPAGTGAGGGTLGTALGPINLTAPTTNFTITIDSALQFLDTGTGNQGPIDSGYYELRLAACMVVTGDLAASYMIVPVDPTSGDYNIGSGVDAMIYPIWQTVSDSPANRDLSASVVASDIAISFLP